MKKGLLFIGITLFNVSVSNASTYYMPDDFPDLQSALSGISGGDTLVIRDGIYIGEENTIYPWEYPPSGSENHYTTIKAENNGGVIFDGEWARQLVNINGNGMNPQPSYIQIEGIIFRNSDGNCVNIVYSNHVKILKCGMYNAVHSSNGTSASPLFFRYADYVLVEDCYIWGVGKYKYYLLDSNHLILRRCIERYDLGISTSGYHSSFRIYSCNDVELQNCISIDADSAHSLKIEGSTVIPTNAHFVIWSGGVNGPNDNVHIRGTIILNNFCGGRAYILQNSYQPQGNTITNSVFWDIKNGLWTRLEVVEGTLFDHLTIGNSLDGGLTGEYGNGVIARNNIIYGTDDYGLKWTDNPNNSSDYNVLYSNEYNYGSGASPQPFDFCLENGNEVDPLTGTPGNGVAALEYLVRIEDFSDLDGTAGDGNDRGANILFRIGESGTLWGETGYNTLTNEPLWPFPNEDLIRDHIQVYLYIDPVTGDTLHGDRGFCKDTLQLNGTDERTLTSYIWEYLGNQMPVNVGIGGETETSIPPDNPYYTCIGLDYVTFNNLRPGNKIEIYDMTGRLVHRSGQIPEDSYIWHLHNISTGIYLYRIDGISTIRGKLLLIR